MRETITCAVCGVETERRGGRQRYCPGCAAERKRERKREHDRAYYEAHREKVLEQQRAYRERKRASESAQESGDRATAPTVQEDRGTKWSHWVNEFTGKVPLHDLSDDELLDLQGEVEYLRGDIGGEVAVRACLVSGRKALLYVEDSP